MIGIYKKDEIVEFLTRKPLVDPLKAYITGWADQIYAIFERVAAEKAKLKIDEKK